MRTNRSILCKKSLAIIGLFLCAVCLVVLARVVHIWEQPQVSDDPFDPKERSFVEKMFAPIDLVVARIQEDRDQSLDGVWMWGKNGLWIQIQGDEFQVIKNETEYVLSDYGKVVIKQEKVLSHDEIQVTVFNDGSIAVFAKFNSNRITMFRR